jgi:hypothetical protein
MKKLENNKRAVPMPRFCRMVWLKNANAREALGFNLI